MKKRGMGMGNSVERSPAFKCRRRRTEGAVGSSPTRRVSNVVDGSLVLRTDGLTREMNAISEIFRRHGWLAERDEADRRTVPRFDFN